ncbi:YhfG family protein [Pseudomonas atacamensis]|nr:YhfG family protein [Pseudomonas atacamensis]MDH2079130.1 YhfG family protein [Pseudomonas atacamensis]
MPKTGDKTALSFEQNQAYYAEAHRSNHLASPHIEGFDTHPTDADKPLPSRESAIKKYRRNRN